MASYWCFCLLILLPFPDFADFKLITSVFLNRDPSSINAIVQFLNPWIISLYVIC